MGANGSRIRRRLGCVVATAALIGGADIARADRPSGWISWLTFAVSQAASTEATPSQHLVSR
jgi:hypothetical protein